MINEKICLGTRDITHDFEDKYNRKYNVQMLRPNFTTDLHMKVILKNLIKAMES